MATNAMRKREQPLRLVVAMTESDGTAYGLRLLEVLRESSIESHLVTSAAARLAIEREAGLAEADLRALAYQTYHESNQAAKISSGSFLTEGMIVAPCGMPTLAAIANGLADNLIHRAADVTLKEGRTLVLLVGASPVSPVHLEVMQKAAQTGIVIAPWLPAAGSPPASELVEETTKRLLAYFDGLAPQPARPGR